MKNSNSNRIIDRTINIFRNYMRQEAIMSSIRANDADRDAFANARSCRMVAREGGFLAKFDRAVAADPALRVFTRNDYCYGKFEAARA